MELFYPAEMKRIRILALESYQDQLVETLHESGAIEIEEMGEEAGWGGREDKRRETLIDLLRRTESLTTRLTPYEKKEETSIKKLLFEKISPLKYDPRLLDEVQGKSYLIKVERRLRAVEEKLSRSEREIEKTASAREVVSRCEGFDIDLAQLKDSRHTFSLVGELLNENLTGFLEEIEPKNVSIFSRPREDKTLIIIIIIGVKNEKDDVVESILRHGFKRYPLPDLRGYPSELLPKYDKKIAKLEEDKRTALEVLGGLAEENTDNLIALREFLGIKKDRVDVYKKFTRSRKTFVVGGFIPEKLVEKTVEELNTAAEGHAVVRTFEPNDDEFDFPVMLDNPGPIKPFQVLTKAYALPKYGEVDPSFLIALWFPFFFGVMLTDAAYGLGLLFLSWFIMYKFESPSIRDIGKILLFSAIWTIILGIAFGSVFGNFFQNFFELSFGVFDPLERADIGLLIAIIIGVVHLNIGLLLGIKRKLEVNDVRGLAFGHLWILLVEISVGLMLFTSGIIMQLIAAILFAGAIGILIKKPGGIGPLEINSLFGTNLSYARLLALSLATTGIALAVNIIGGLLLGSIVGSVIGILILLGGHVFNFGINVFGAFVHSMRLHYVEFFSMFYEGGGREFSPFIAKRRYTKKGGD